MKWSRVLLTFAGVGLIGLALGSTVAVAEDVISLSRSVATGLTTPRDPAEFVREMAPVMPRPVVPLTREDAVANELLTRNRTMTEGEVLRVAQALCEEAEALGHDPLLFLAVIRVESNFNHYAVSPVGAEGLMQLMPPTAEWMAERVGQDWSDHHSFDPVLNVRLGSRYLAHLYRQLGRMDFALTAYNRGPQATRYIVRKYGDLPQEVHDFYSGKVLANYRRLQGKYGHLPLS